jgi:hypothetical protein
MSRERDASPQCPSCGNLTHQGNGFCGHCGTDLIEVEPTKVSRNGQNEDNVASPASAEPMSARPIGEQMRSYFSSAFKKKITDDLAEAFASLDPRETPWFGLDLDADLVAVTPYGVTVVALVDSGAVENATVFKSLFPEGPWLLTTPDGTDLAIDNPIVNAQRAMRAFEDKLTAFFRHRRETSQTIRVNGLIVFPDGYDLKHANEPYTLAEGSAGLRVINADELAKELLEPGQARLSPELGREWLYTSILPSRDDDSIALTWLDPNGETISKRVRTLTNRRRPDDYRAQPPRSSEVFTNPGAASVRRRPRFGMIAAVSLVVVVGSMALWDIYAPQEPLSQSFLARRVLGKNGRTPELSRPNDPAPAKEPQRSEVPGDRDLRALQNSQPSSDGNGVPENKIADSKAAEAVSQAEGSSPDLPVVTARQKTVEAQIDRAIHLRAVDGVYVVFVNDTAYLTGSVLSEKQKAAAEEAARKVPGVKRVQSSILVKWQTG